MEIPADEDRLDASKIDYVSIGGLDTRYYVDGSGPPLVLIHGGQFGSDYALGSWSLNLPGLADDFTVYAFDKIGQGFTDNPKHEEDYTFESVCEHALGFLAANDIEDAHVVGHSRGGLVSAWLGLNHPDRIATSTIVDSSTTSFIDADKSFEFRRTVNERLPSDHPTIDSVRIEPELRSYSADHLTSGFLERKLEILQLDKTNAAREVMETANDERFLPSIDRIRDDVHGQMETDGFEMPLLVAWGQNDPSARIEWGRELFDFICEGTDQAEMHTFNCAGHYAFRERPHEFNRLLRSFCLG